MDGENSLVVQDLSPFQIQLLVDDLLLGAHDARRSAEHFMEFAIKEETTRVPLVTAPHQRVIYEFIEAHEKCVISLPPGHSKTFNASTIVLRLLGEDPTVRGAIVSATQTQAEKPLGMVRDYIESSPELRIVYPELIPSLRQGDSWSQTSITVHRPPGIRDASLIAVGFRGAIDGSRLKWVIVDDLLNGENTSTLESRDSVHRWFDSSVMTRLDPTGSKIVVNNTAWHPDDLAHRLEKMGWPTLRMGITGYVEIHNTDFDSKELRPSSPGSLECRLTGNDPDPFNEKTLWPARIDTKGVEELRRTHLPSTFARIFDQKCRDNEESKCKEEWIDAALEKGKGLTFLSEYRGTDPVFCGVDLGVAEKETSADTAFFTFRVAPSGHRIILNIEAGKWDGPTIIKKLIANHKAYNSILRVENNAAQDFIRQFALDVDVALPIQAHTTGRAKAHPEHGVAGLFIELANGAWVIPCDMQKQVDKVTRRFIDACLYYSVNQHTDDVMMAAYFARESAKKYGVVSGGGTSSMAIQNIGGMIMAR